MSSDVLSRRKCGVKLELSLVLYLACRATLLQCSAFGSLCTPRHTHTHRWKGFHAAAAGPSDGRAYYLLYSNACLLDHEQSVRRSSDLPHLTLLSIERDTLPVQRFFVLQPSVSLYDDQLLIACM